MISRLIGSGLIARHARIMADVKCYPPRDHLISELRVIIIIIIIINMSYHQHGYPWPFLTIPSYRPLLPAGLKCYIPYRHRATVCRFELVVLPLLVHVKGSTGVHHFRLLQLCSAWLVRLTWIVFVIDRR